MKSARSGEVATGDPWDGRTLEWSISSPPPEYNFEQIPTVHGKDPFWAQKYEGVAMVPVAGGLGEEGGHSIHLPQASYWPFVASIGIFIGGFGVLYINAASWIGVAVGVIGALITMIAVYAWSLEPVNDPDDGTAH